MGKIAKFFEATGLPLAGQDRLKMLALDREFSQLQTENEALQAQNLKLQAQVNPLERQIQQCKEQVARMTRRQPEPLEEMAEKILQTIAENPHSGLPERSIAPKVGISAAEAAYHLGLLCQRFLIKRIPGMSAAYKPRQEGLAYLKKKGLL